MAYNEIPEEVNRFITNHINSIEQLEVLLLLFNNANREWDANEVSRELRISSESAAARFEDLRSRGLLYTNKKTGKYQYYPQNSDLDRAVNRLDRAYKEHRVTLINLIFSKPIDKIRTFADAFKITSNE